MNKNIWVIGFFGLLALLLFQYIFALGKVVGVSEHPFVASKTGKICYSIESISGNLKDPIWFKDIKECLHFINLVR